MTEWHAKKPFTLQAMPFWMSRGAQATSAIGPWKSPIKMVRLYSNYE